jgi:hypothetical protein
MRSFHLVSLLCMRYINFELQNEITPKVKADCGADVAIEQNLYGI